MHRQIQVFLYSFLAVQTAFSFAFPTSTNVNKIRNCRLVDAPQNSFRSKVSSSQLSFGLGNNDKNNDGEEMNLEGEEEAASGKRGLSSQLRRSLLISTLLAGVTNLGLAYAAPPNFKRIPTQFIAALGDPDSTSGSNASDWGLWTVDPGPRGVWLRDYDKQIVKKNGVAPAGWNFNEKDWWLEEHGLIMEAPTFPMEAGRYLVTGGRLVTTVLDVKSDGTWSLEKGKLFDVTHLPCRSARYTPASGVGNGSPFNAKEGDFPVKPGAEMPRVEGCDKLDYAVLFLIGKEVV